MAEVEQLARLAREAGIHDDTEIQLLLRAANQTSNGKLAKHRKKAVREKLLNHLQYPFSEQTPAASSFEHKLYLGNTQRKDKPYYIPETELTRHLLTVGETGSGKTTLHYNLIDQLSIPVWMFDLKQDYRHLIQKQPNLLVIPQTKLKFNPLQPPPGVNTRSWSATFSEIFTGAYDLLEGSSGFMRTLLKELYHDQSKVPTLYDLQEKIRDPGINYMLPSASYQDRIYWRLRGLRSDTESMTNCRNGFPLRNLLKRDVVFELDNLPRKTQNFLMEILLAWIYRYRKAQNQRGNKLRHVTILDEGHTIFSWYKEQQEAAGMPEIDRMVKLLREFGEGLVTADQEASKLTDSIKANTATKILLASGDQKQYESITESMKLSSLQKNWSQLLDTGEAIIQHGNTEPVPVNLNDYKIAKGITNNDLENRLETEYTQLQSSVENTGTDTPENPQEKLENYS